MGCAMKIAIVVTVIIKIVNARLGLDPEDLRRPFDQDLYARVLDPVACRAQLRDIAERNPVLLLRFLDAGIRLPRGVLRMNFVDLGNYHQCLGIDEELEGTRIQGKYCMIDVPTDQDIQLPQFAASGLRMDEATRTKLEQSHTSIYKARAVHALEDIKSGPMELPSFMFRLAVCIPKPCTSEDILSVFPFNVSAVGFRLTELFCRLPDDKQWVAADTVAVVVFSLIGFLTLLSTCYDVCHTHVFNKDPKSANPMCILFSVYTNTHRLLTFKTSKGALECLDGIRVISMMWIILGHALTMHPIVQNLVPAINWIMGPEALWLTTAPVAVDTFFMISGVLIVYTTAGKMTGRQLIGNVHLFYLHRLLRMFPALAALVLLQASVFHRIADGPVWHHVARNTQTCRSYWWSTLLHIQNHVNPLSMCIAHSWYLAIDVQMYIVSPLILFWVLGGSRRAAWSALALGLLAILTGSTVFNFLMELPGGTTAINRWGELDDFMKYYYFNTLTRGAPFFVGMIVGYVLHVCRGTKVNINLFLLCLLWAIALATFASPFYTTYLIKQPDWDNQTVDSLINSFQRTVWVAGIGWIIFACVHGYGGPINWLLSLPMWKLPSRLSYAMYLYHYPIMFIFGDRSLAPVYFSVTSTIMDFISQFSLTVLVALAVAVIIEAPFSKLFNLILGNAALKPKKVTENAPAPKNEMMS